ncbi:hypothetical protein SNE40_009458 [Patella caerulea]|uniref:Delta(14)-sterol reductase n=2 Tax=Patella caerulea TaxID=87958 RepID=A0AAN8JVH9_PATCE
MPSTPRQSRKSSKSPGRGLKKTTSGRSRSRSKSRSRATKSVGKSPARPKASKSPAPKSRTPAKSPARTPRASRTPKAATSPVQEDKVDSIRPRTRSRSRTRTPVDVTSVRQSTRISALVEREKQESSKIVEQLRSEVQSKMSDIKDKAVEKTKNKEFGGPIGTFLLVLLLPTVVFLLNFACNKKRCTIMEIPKLPKSLSFFFDLQATYIFLGWFAFQAALAVLPVGKLVEGQPLKSGGRLKYRCNGFFALIVSIAAFGLGVYYKLPLDIVHAKFFQIMTAATLFSVLLSIALYAKSLVVPKNKLAPGGNTGNHIYDFFMGHELNPRIGTFDLKFFCELRPGLIGWVMFNLIFVYKAYLENNKEFPPALTLAAAFQIFYVADALFAEEAILTTMDIVHDGFGFMLAFGDLVWVPFCYNLQTRFLLENPQNNMYWYCLAAIGVLNVIGYYIFRGSNSQKDAYRKDPHNPALAHLETIPTSTGRRLLVSGWWGLCRKPNYLGDLIMATAWSMCCGFHHVLPYFYPIYFLVLLIHRGMRDDVICRKKYGASWTRYCQRVPYKIIPYVY